MSVSASVGPPPRRGGIPTLLDVASAAGVSPMTVSRVLAGGKNVRQDKIDAVLAAASALGYRRNENARSIRPGQRTGLVGLVITNVLNPYYAELQLGLEEVVSQTGARLLVGNSGEDPDRERQLVLDFIGRQVDGLIVVPSAGPTEHLQPDNLHGTPLVLASRRPSGIDADSVLVDDIHGATEGTLLLLNEGHRRIAFIGNMLSVFTSRRRLDGFIAAHRQRGLEPDPNLIRSGQQDPVTAQRTMQAMLSMPDPPTAVFSANNRNTIGVLRALRALHVDAAAIRVVGFDNFELSDMTPFPLTVIDHDARELGRQAGRLLLERLQMHPEMPAEPRVVQLPTRLLAR